LVVINHQNGWYTGYYHLRNIQVHPTNNVLEGTWIGDLAQTEAEALPCKGSWSKDYPHVHFFVKYSTSPIGDPFLNIQPDVDLEGISLGGWRVKKTTSAEGCMTYQSTGEQQCSPGGVVTNHGTHLRAGSVATALPPGSRGGYVLASDGNLTAFGGAPAAHVSQTVPGDLARALVLLPDGSGGYFLDGYGGLHAFAVGSHPMPPGAGGSPYWPNWDIARGIVLLPDGPGGYVLDGWGGLHPFAIGSGQTAPTFNAPTYWQGWDIARGIALNPKGTGGYVLDGYGALHPFAIGSNPMPPAVTTSAYWKGWDIARAVALDFTGISGYVLEGYGGLHPFAAQGTPMPPPAHSPDYAPGKDTARGVALYPVKNSGAPEPGAVSGEYVTADSTTPHSFAAVDAGRRVIPLPGQPGAGYLLAGDGMLTPYGGAPPAHPSATWSSWDIARDAVVLTDGTGGYVLDGWGGLHPFAIGTNPFPLSASGSPYWPNWDIARAIVLLPDGTGGYVLDGYGGLHAFALGTNPKPAAASGSPYWAGWDIARAIVLVPKGTGGYVLDGYGGLHAFAIGSNPKPPAASGSPYWAGWDIARAIALMPQGTGGYVLDGWGGLHPFALGSNPKPSAVKGYPYWPGWDVVGSVAASKAPRQPLKLATLDSHGGLGWATAGATQTKSATAKRTPRAKR
jgi:hypothetical protein